MMRRHSLSTAVLVSCVLAVPTTLPLAANAAPTAGPAASAAASAPLLAVAGRRKPRGTVSAVYTVLANGRLSVVVRSDAAKVQLKYRTAKHKKRTTSKKVRNGVAVSTLPAGSRSIFVRSKATRKLAASRWVAAIPATTPPTSPPTSPPPVTPPPHPGPTSPPPTDPTTPPPTEPPFPWVRRASVSSVGAQGQGASQLASVSGDGRFVAFQSDASNLVGQDGNGVGDVFVHDRQTGETARVSVASDGSEANGKSGGPSISADGRYVAFQSDAWNLVDGDANGRGDVFVHDRQQGTTIRASVASTGAEGNNHSKDAAISANGRFVVFTSAAATLIVPDDNVLPDVFVRDLQEGETTRVSSALGGREPNGESGAPSISADGRLIVFASWADNLVDDDDNTSSDVFVHDQQTNALRRITVGPKGEANAASWDSAISADGRFVAFGSYAFNLVDGDPVAESDVFLHDLEAGTTAWVSVPAAGVVESAGSRRPSISADGSFVAYESDVPNLVAGDGNAKTDVFVFDRATSTTTRRSVAEDGTQGNGDSGFPAIAGTGLVIAYQSEATNLVEGDTNGVTDVFSIRVG